MAGLVPAIHVFLHRDFSSFTAIFKTWMPASGSPLR
jgi:hypothetical protein